MALGGVTMKDTDGNIGYTSKTETEKVTGLLFDISGQTDFWTNEPGLSLKDKLQGNVIEINSMADLEKLGITKADPDVSKGLFNGVVYYHVNHFFQIQGENGRLFLMFADCSKNWDAIDKMQNVAHGLIHQLGVYTDQSLWKLAEPEGEFYSVELVTALNNKARDLANNNMPLSIVLQANSGVVTTHDGTSEKVELAKIPSCKMDARYVTVLLSQALDPEITKMQVANKKKTPVGVVGICLGCLAKAHVHESFAWIEKFNLGGYFPDIEMGFGDLTSKDSGFTSTMAYSSFNKVQLDVLDDKGYVFLCKQPGLEGGVFFSKDQTSSAESSDYRTVARNRTINKSRRAVRNVLLPFVNSPLKIDPSSGKLSSAKVTMFQNLVGDVLMTMQNNEEISGFSVKIDPNQNVLKNDTLIIQYSLVPIGVASEIKVIEGLALTNK